MTIEELVGASSEQLASMTDAQLLEYFKPYEKHTRPPDKIDKVEDLPIMKSNKLRYESKVKSRNIRQAELLLAELERQEQSENI